MKNKIKKLFITGGHITPALAVIDEIKKTHKDWNIILVGRNTFEERFAHEKNIGFTRYLQAFMRCVWEKPDLIVSFGSYVALPTCIAAWIVGIPIIIHEQTLVPGRANRLIAKIARRICVTFDQTAREFPKEKTIVTGLPVRQELFHPPKEAPPGFMKADRSIIYITGGSTGAESLNTILFPIIKHLLSSFTVTVVHQTGLPSLAKAKEIMSQQYIARDFFDVETLSWIYHNAELVIARSGANTVMELAMLGKQAILVPLPWSQAGEQEANAVWLSRFGMATVVLQKDIQLNELLELIKKKIEQKPVPIATAGILRNGAISVSEQIDAILK